MIRTSEARRNLGKRLKKRGDPEHGGLVVRLDRTVETSTKPSQQKSDAKKGKLRD